MRSKQSGALDAFRVLAVFLVIANHTSPLLSIHEEADFILTRIVSRVAVPFFLMVSGYFLYNAMEQRDWRHILRFCKKIAILYGISIVLFLPLNVYAGHYHGEYGWVRFIKDLFFNGTFYHLWYLPGLILGIVIVAYLTMQFGQVKALWISFVLYGIGLLGDSYYGIAVNIPMMKQFYDGVFILFDYTRNGIFMVPIFLMMGMFIHKRKAKVKLSYSIVALIVSLILLIVEGMVLHGESLQRHDSMYIMLIPTMYLLFVVLLQCRGRNSKTLRDLTTAMYIIHPWMIVVVRFIAKGLHIENILIANHLLHYVAVSLLSLLFGLLWIILKRNREKRMLPATKRAWVEVNLQALVHNVRELKRILPQRTQVMAVVKANAYGHGAIQVARTLSREGIRSFAVATLSEGIELRKHRIRGDILILGYTPPENIHLIQKYRLTQTIVDASYAKELNAKGVRIDVQLKIDTGMHRLGVEADHLHNIAEVYRCESLNIVGVFSHLSVADSLDREHIAYTKMQMEHFNRTLQWMKSQGYKWRYSHIQASYGILNYPYAQYDLVRAGIALYGVLSSKDRVLSEIALQPVLSIKARVATVKALQPGESVGYGNAYMASEAKKIAIVTIGYADGVPRQWTRGQVLIRGQKASIIGRICMDQLMVDVTHIDDVAANDIVTVIGIDGEVKITCEDVAEQSETISNEILSRLGSRLEYVYRGA